MNNSDNEISLLNIKVGEINGAVDIKHVLKVISLPELGKTPTDSHYILGLLNLGGTVVPVVDLKTRLGEPRREALSIETPILLCKTKQGTLGLAVDEVKDIVKADESDITHNTDYLENTHVTDGTVVIDNEIFVKLNIEKILEPELYTKSVRSME